VGNGDFSPTDLLLSKLTSLLVMLFMEASMLVKSGRWFLASVALVSSLTVSSNPLLAATLSTMGGATYVDLAPSFLSGFSSLGVVPAAIAPASIIPNLRGATAFFPITTGAVDNVKISTELDHSGGLSLTAGSIRASITSFIIDSATAKLTGLVTCNGTLAGRVALFDLKLSQAPKLDTSTLSIDGVGVTLSSGAASALSGCFKKTVPAISVGTAKVRAVLGPEL
jgi:hypothetical protein